MTIIADSPSELQTMPLFDLLAKNPDGYFVLDENHLILYANAMAIAITSLSAEKLLGRKIMFSFSIDNNIEIKYQNATDQTRLLDIWTIKIQWNEQVILIIRVRDLSLRQLPNYIFSEDNTPFKQLADNIKEAFWLATYDHTKVLYVSPAYEKIWGRSRASLYKNPASWMQSIVFEDHEKVFIGLDRNINGNEKLDIEYRIKRPNGEIRYIRDRAFPIRDANGNIESVAGIAEDITEQRKVEAAMKQHKAQIARLSRINTAGELVSSIAHELNQPLTTVIQYIGGCLLKIERDAPKTDIVFALNKAMSHIERAGDIVHKLKKFLRKGHKKKQVFTTINNLVNTVLALVNSEIVMANIKLILKSLEMETRILIDTVQIEQH